MEEKNDDYIEQVRTSLRRQVEKFRENSKIPPDLMRYSWKDYKINDNEQVDENGKKIILSDEVIESRKEALEMCAAYAKNISLMGQVIDEDGNILPYASLLLIGTKGSGKSVLGSLILRKAMSDLMKETLYVSFASFISDLHAATMMGPRYEKRYNEMIDRYYNPDILMIDEIDAGHYVTKQIQQHIDTILSRRADWDKPTIITSRLPYLSLAAVIGIPASRIVGKPENYIHVNILNNKYVTPDALLSAEQKYPSGKCTELFSWLKELVKMNKERGIGTGLYGHQIRECLESALRHGQQDSPTKRKILNHAMSILPEEDFPTLEEEDKDIIVTREMHEKKLKEEKKRQTKKKKQADKKKKELTDSFDIG